jgi:hypothetical protein
MLSNDRKLLMKKAWKFRRLKKNQPLTEAWKWLYVKRGKKIVELFTFSINSDIEHLSTKMFELEYQLCKEDGIYILIFWDLKRSGSNILSFEFDSRSSIPHALGILYFYCSEKNTNPVTRHIKI